MKSLTSVLAVIVLLTTSVTDTHAASRSKSSKHASENQITAQLNREQLTGTPQATAPSATPQGTSPKAPKSSGK